MGIEITKLLAKLHATSAIVHSEAINNITPVLEELAFGEILIVCGFLGV